MHKSWKPLHSEGDILKKQPTLFACFHLHLFFLFTCILLCKTSIEWICHSTIGSTLHVYLALKFQVIVLCSLPGWEEAGQDLLSHKPAGNELHTKQCLFMTSVLYDQPKQQNHFESNILSIAAILLSGFMRMKYIAIIFKWKNWLSNQSVEQVLAKTLLAKFARD